MTMASHTLCRSCLQALRTQGRQQIPSQPTLLMGRAALPHIRSYASDSDKHSTQHSRPPPPRQEGLPTNPSPRETRHPPPQPPPQTDTSNEPSPPSSSPEKGDSTRQTASGPSSGSTSHPNSDKDPIQASTPADQTPQGRPTNPAPPARNAAPPPPSSSESAHPDSNSAPPSASARNPAYFQRPIEATSQPSGSKKSSANDSPPARNAAPTPPPPKPRPHKSQDTEKQQANPLASFAAQVRRSDALKSTTEPYIAYGGTEELFKECARQCDYTIPARLKQPPEPAPKNTAGEDIGVGTGWWFVPKVPAGVERSGHGGVSGPGLGLDVTFNSWAQVMYLHMYVLTVRLRCFPTQHARVWHQHLLDHFFYAAEDRMAVWHGMVARSVRNKYLKDLWQQWRGVLLSYDEGLIKGDAVLAAAVWRNVFKASEGVDLADLALVTAYLRAQLKMLDGVGDERVVSGEITFGDPNALRGLLDRESKGMREGPMPEELKTGLVGKAG